MDFSLFSPNRHGFTTHPCFKTLVDHHHVLEALSLPLAHMPDKHSRLTSWFWSLLVNACMYAYLVISPMEPIARKKNVLAVCLCYLFLVFLYTFATKLMKIRGKIFMHCQSQSYLEGWVKIDQIKLDFVRLEYDLD